MPSLETAATLGEGIYHRADGLPFVGSIQPLRDGSNAGFIEPRFFLRVRVDCPVQTRNIILDSVGRRFLCANYDQGLISNIPQYRTHLLFLMNNTVTLEKPVSSNTDLLTGLQRSSGKEFVDMVEALIEPLGRDSADAAFRVQEQVRRLVTGYPIQLGDIVDNMVVKKVYPIFGVWVAEIE